MKRRDFVLALAAGSLGGLAKPTAAVPLFGFERPDGPLLPNVTPVMRQLEQAMEQDALPAEKAPIPAAVFLDTRQQLYLRLTLARLRRLQRLVGFGNFNLLDYRSGLRYAANYSRVGAFPKAEQNFLEEMFFADVSRYGFFGEKVIERIDERVNQRQVVKIPGSGHYLFKGEPLALYNRVKRDVGPSIVLTSGIRGVMKQTYLFLNKVAQSAGNLSEASRSLAPPGHSFHGTGDFDVGKVGFGERNFTADFARTEEFKRLTDLGYVLIRYPSGNPFGVRYEPWHIKVA